MTILSYNGNQIQQRQDGFVNLTQMAQANGVLIGHWLALDSTKSYCFCRKKVLNCKS